MVVGYFIYLFISVNLFLLSFVPKDFCVDRYEGLFTLVEAILILETIMLCAVIVFVLLSLIIWSISQVIL